MKEFLETTVGKIILGVLVAVIWGVNVINFSEMSTSTQAQVAQQVQSINLEELILPKKMAFQYNASGRDPFRNGIREPEFEEVFREEVNEVENYIEPRLKLAGIFDGMAVISDESGRSYFVENGDKFKDEILVKNIVQDSVVLEYKQRNLILKLN